MAKFNFNDITKNVEYEFGFWSRRINEILPKGFAGGINVFEHGGRFGWTANAIYIYQNGPTEKYWWGDDTPTSYQHMWSRESKYREFATLNEALMNAIETIYLDGLTTIE